MKPGRGFGPGIKEMHREELFNVISSGGGGWTFEDERSLTEARKNTEVSVVSRRRNGGRRK